MTDRYTIGVGAQIGSPIDSGVGRSARSGPAARASACWLLFASLCAPLAAHADAVAMIVDVKGGGCTLRAASSTPCEILGYLQPDSTLSLAKGGRVTVVYFGSGREYALAGPGSTRIDDVAPTTLQGAAPQSRELALARDTGLRAADVQRHKQAALVLRGAATTRNKLRLGAPRNTSLINARPTFEWQAVESAAQYRFVLIDEDGRIVLQTLVDNTRFNLPSEITLSGDTVYTWQVHAQLADGTALSSSADFTLLDDNKRRALQKLRPAAGAPVSELVLYALVLDREGVRDEARRWWSLAAEQRPADERLKTLAAR